MKKTTLTVLILALGMIVKVAKADFVFGEPTNLGPTVNSSTNDYDPSMSTDELELYLVSERSGGFGGRDLWVTTRASVSDLWAGPVNLGSTINTAYNECCPDISSDGLSLFFWSNRPGGSGGEDLWVTTREAVSGPWGPPVNLGPTVNSSAWDGGPCISTDGLALFFFSTRSGGSGGMDLWVTRRTTVSEPWGSPENLGPTVNSSADDATPDISADGLTLFFHSTRSGGYGSYDLWVTTRTTLSNSWGSPVNLGPTINSSTYDFSPNISADSSIFFFSSSQSGGSGGEDIWQVAISPVVDFNGDGIVDSADMCIMVDHWGENYALCDIGPMPWGDGIVDVEDLKVLAEHLFTYPGAVAYWTLDETEGNIAYDSVGICNGTLIGGPVWQPDGGMEVGALQFDGIDDYISTDPVLNPADGPFSVFAWIKGTTPGQVILSQADHVNWLLADSSSGNLTTEIKGSGRSAGALLSQTNITDGNWHRVGLVWDGLLRTLFVDDVVVAEDTQEGIESSSNGLYIGTGKTTEPGTFWAGLIDDIRIYNRVVNP